MSRRIVNRPLVLVSLLLRSALTGTQQRSMEINRMRVRSRGKGREDPSRRVRELPDKEEIIGDTDASRMLVRPYRQPWDAELRALGIA